MYKRENYVLSTNTYVIFETRLKAMETMENLKLYVEWKSLSSQFNGK